MSFEFLMLQSIGRKHNFGITQGRLALAFHVVFAACIIRFKHSKQKKAASVLSTIYEGVIRSGYDLRITEDVEVQKRSKRSSKEEVKMVISTVNPSYNSPKYGSFIQSNSNVSFNCLECALVT